MPAFDPISYSCVLSLYTVRCTKQFVEQNAPQKICIIRNMLTS